MTRTKIRHNLGFVTASDIAKQWYCEKAIDLQYQHPDVVLKVPELDLGTARHELIAREAEPITKGELIKFIKSDKTFSLQQSRFNGAYGHVLIKGIPDYVEIKGRKANILVEFKFSKYKRIFPEYRIQLDTYGYLLYKNRFDINNLFCGVAIFPRHSKFGEKTFILNTLNQSGVIDEVIEKIKKRLSEMRNKRLDRFRFDEPDSFNGYLYSFSLSIAKKNLKWAMGYWLKNRDPLPTKKAYKCRICSYNIEGLCNVASAKVDKRRKKIKKKKR